MGCINGGRVKGMACVRVLWANGRGGREQEEKLKSSSSPPLHTQGKKRSNVV